MNNQGMAVATMTWARNEEEETELKEALKVLAGFHLPVYVTDGGSSGSFLAFLKSFPHFTVASEKGLWPQVKKSLQAAVASGARVVLYTEPDKKMFFQNHLPAILKHKVDGVVLASRSAAGMVSFPTFQQMTETAINNCCNELIGQPLDYCYGPFLFDSKLVAWLDALPADCGWGWRPYLFHLAHRLGLPVDAFTGDFLCPEQQRYDDPQERVYRIKQLQQNIEGLLLAQRMTGADLK